MKKFILWFLAIVITLAAAIYQRKTGPTYARQLEITLNNSIHKLKLIRSLGLNEKPEIRLNISDTTVKAKLFFKRFKTDEEYQTADFVYKVYPVNSFVMNKIFRIYKEKGLFANIPQQPAAGKIQYYFEITDSNGTRSFFEKTPVVLRFKGDVPAYVLIPHILLMFMAMLFSTLAGLMSVIKYPSYKKFGLWTLILLIAGGFIFGPIVEHFAFGEFWTGIPFGWDLTDNKTLIALIFWTLAVAMNRKKEKPLYTVLAAIVLLCVFSIPHSLMGSELNYSTGKVIQGIILTFF
jgi:hypothetical protein